MPDMLSTTDGYLDDTGLFDLQAVSTMGLQEEDLEAVLDTEGVQEAEVPGRGRQAAGKGRRNIFGYGTCPGPWLSDRRQDHSL